MPSAVVSLATFNLLKPVLYLGRTFGLLPAQWRRVGPTYVFSRSLTCQLYSHGLTLFLVGMSIFGLHEVNKLDVVYSVRLKENTGRYVSLSDICVVLLSCLFGVVMASLKIDRFVDYLGLLGKIDSLLPRYPDRRPKYLWVTITTLCLTTLVLGMDLWLWTKISIKYENILVLLRNFLPYYCCYYYTIVIELMYWHLVHSVKVRVLALNSCLSEMNRSLLEHFPKITNKNIGNIIDCLSVNQPNKTSSSSKYETINFLKSRPILDLPIKDIRNLITAYEKLHEACDLINDSFGMMILIVIMGCLVHFLVTPYALYLMIQNTGESLFIMSQTAWMIAHFLRLLLIVEPCQDCVVETRTTMQLVCRLVSSRVDEVTRRELKVFVLSLAQCPIEFTACHLTRIDRSLLTTITGAVTTYLVILFQFN